jgi:hypothetical protein
MIICDPSDTISAEDTGNANTQMSKPGVNTHCNPVVYYMKVLLFHWTYIWHLHQWHQRHPYRDIMLYKDTIKAAFR